MGFCRPSGASGLVRPGTHGLRRGLLSYAPLGLQGVIMCGIAICSVWIVLAPPAFAFEPMPPIMQKLLEVFPEENGRFVDEPFGSIESMPKEARTLFETFRVVVPTPDDIDKNLARLFSASSHFPIKKITRYDNEPGAPGLPGFRGVWCQTEDESQVGFSIVTINQNRFLIWAKMGYYPAFANDSINPKVRDQYARDVSQYLAGIDFKVPDNEAPQAGGRGLPEWMGLFPARVDVIRVPGIDPRRDGLGKIPPIGIWGLRNVFAFVPDSILLDSIAGSATDTLWLNPDLKFIQKALDPGPYHVQRTIGVRNLTKMTFDSLRTGRYLFVMDRFGRVRFQETEEGGDGALTTTYFPALPILAQGIFVVNRCCAYDANQYNVLVEVGTYSGPYFYSWYDSTATVIAAQMTDEHLKTLGHFIKLARLLSLPYHPLDGLRIRKFSLTWD